jgi:hypothetical protein
MPAPDGPRIRDIPTIQKGLKDTKLVLALSKWIDRLVRVRTHKLNENSDDDFEPRTELNQPAGGLPVLIAA